MPQDLLPDYVQTGTFQRGLGLLLEGLGVDISTQIVGPGGLLRAPVSQIVGPWGAREYSNLLRPLINILFLLVSYGHIIIKKEFKRE